MEKKAQKITLLMLLGMTLFTQAEEDQPLNDTLQPEEATFHVDSILNDSLDDFLKRVVEEEEQPYFRGAYSQFLEKVSKKRRNGKQRFLRRMRSAALKKVREEHPAWYKEIEPYVLDIDEPTPEARKVRLFLTRFALLEEYHESLNQDTTNWWDTTKNYVKGFGNKVAQLKDRVFKGSKKTTKA